MGGVDGPGSGYADRMGIEEQRDELDPSEVQPTDNSSGVPVDLDRLDDIQEELEQKQP